MTWCVTCVKQVASCFLVMKLVWFTVIWLCGAFPCEQMIEPLKEADGGKMYKREIRKLLFCKKICYGGLCYTDITFSIIDWLTLR